MDGNISDMILSSFSSRNIFISVVSNWLCSYFIIAQPSPSNIRSNCCLIDLVFQYFRDFLVTMTPDILCHPMHPDLIIFVTSFSHSTIINSLRLGPSSQLPLSAANPFGADFTNMFLESFNTIATQGTP